MLLSWLGRVGRLGTCKFFLVSHIVAAGLCYNYMLLWWLGRLGRVGRLKNCWAVWAYDLQKFFRGTTKGFNGSKRYFRIRDFWTLCLDGSGRWQSGAIYYSWQVCYRVFRWQRCVAIQCFAYSCSPPLVGAWGFAGVVVVNTYTFPRGAKPRKGGDVCVSTSKFSFGYSFEDIW